MGRNPRSLRLSLDGTTYEIEVDDDGSVTLPGRAEPVWVNRLDASTFQVTLDGRQLLVYLAVEGTRGWAFADGCVFGLDLAPGQPRRVHATDSTRSLAAPMPARVLSVLVERGQTVRRGDPLILLEAMKMEITLRAPRDGQIETLACADGDLVQPGAPLVTLIDLPSAQTG